MWSVTEQERFTRLLIRHEPELLRTALVAVPHRADARDILQEAAVALWRRFSEYDPQRPFVNWAAGFVRMEVRRFLRKAQQRAQLTAKAAELLLEEETRLAPALDEREGHLRHCLDALPKLQRRLLDGYYREERTITELSAESGRTVDSAYKTLQRIRLALQRCIDLKMKGAGV